jgi:hypothetical protein
MKTTCLPFTLLVGSFALGAMTTAADTAAPAPVAPPEPATEFGAHRPTARVATNVLREEIWSMPAAPEKIFPLLCPVLEYDWIPFWRAQLIHSASGVAEKGCIFETRFPDSGRSVWVCTHYAPPTRIEYTTFQENGVLARLEITLRATAGGTEMRWTRTWHALDERGAATLSRWDDQPYQAMNHRLQTLLRHYLETGTMLRLAPQP